MKSDLWMLCCWCHWVCIIRSYLSERGDLIKTNRSVKLQIQWAVLSSFRQLLSSCTPLSICSANLIVVFQQYSPDSACNRAFLSEAATNSLLNQQKHPGGEMNALSVCLYMCSYEAGSALCCPADAVRRSRSDLRIPEGSDLYREPEKHMYCESRSDPPTRHNCTLIVSGCIWIRLLQQHIVCTAYANSSPMPWGKSSLLRSCSFPNELEVISVVVCNVSFLIALMRSCDNNVALKYLLHNIFCFSFYFYSHHISYLRLLANMFISWGQSSLEHESV